MKLLPMLLSAAVALAATMTTQAADSKIYQVPVKDIDGKETTLKPYQGKALLIVNVASKCGNTPQYKELESLYQKFKDKGLVVLGFPCNDFGSQEPGSNAEIKEFCSTKYNVTFPMFDKVHVKGPETHPLYTELSGEQSPFPGPVKWNFGKFLVGKDGKVLARFEPKTKPESPEVTSAVEKALAQ